MLVPILVIAVGAFVGWCTRIWLWTGVRIPRPRERYKWTPQQTAGFIAVVVVMVAVGWWALSGPR